MNAAPAVLTVLIFRANFELVNFCCFNTIVLYKIAKGNEIFMFFKLFLQFCNRIIFLLFIQIPNLMQIWFCLKFEMKGNRSFSLICCIHKNVYFWFNDQWSIPISQHRLNKSNIREYFYIIFFAFFYSMQKIFKWSSNTETIRDLMIIWSNDHNIDRVQSITTYTSWLKCWTKNRVLCQVAMDFAPIFDGNRSVLIAKCQRKKNNKPSLLK